MADAKVVTGVVVAVTGDRIAAIGLPAEIRKKFPSGVEIDCRGGVLTPVSSIRTPTPYSENRAPRSKSCARPASAIWKSQNAVAAFIPPCAICERDPRLS